MAVIEVRNLRKSYGDSEAVRGVSFTVERGEVYGLLGHNGAGKSTTVEILEGHRTLDAGSVSVLGFDPAQRSRAFRSKIGIVLQSMTVERFLTVRETLDTFAAVYPDPRPVDEVIELVGLTDKADDRVRSLSGGQQRRLDLGLGIIGNPEVLFLDEPTTGFDPVARRQSWELVRRLGDGGTTVLLTTHYLDEAEHLADRVGVLAHGRLVAEGTPAELVGLNDTRIRFRLPAGLAPTDLDVPPRAVVIADGASTTVELMTPTPTADIAVIATRAAERGIELDDLVVSRPTLEDAFLQIEADNDDTNDTNGDSNAINNTVTDHDADAAAGGAAQ